MIVVPQIPFRAGEPSADHGEAPARIVDELVARGAPEVAILDLDGAIARDVLPEWTRSLVADAAVPVRFDGHLHDGSRIERLAGAGFSTIVVDQRAVFEPVLLRWALDVFGPRLAVELQVDGEYVFDPPTSAFHREVVDVLADLHLQGVRRLLYRDVTGQQLPVQQLRDLAERLPGMRIDYHGRAVRGRADLRELAVVGPALEAVLVDAQLVLDGSLDAWNDADGYGR